MATYFITGRKTTSSFHIKVRGSSVFVALIFYMTVTMTVTKIVMLTITKIVTMTATMTVTKIVTITVTREQVEGQQAEAGVLPAFTGRSSFNLISSSKQRNFCF